MSLLLSLGFLFTIIINFCVKSVHSLLGFPASNENKGKLQPPRPRRALASPAGSLSLFTFSSDIHQIANPVNSSAESPLASPTATGAGSMKKDPGGIGCLEEIRNIRSSAIQSRPSPPIFAAVKKDPGGIGCLDEIGGSADGLMTCTESIGFESSDERRIDYRFEIIDNVELESRYESRIRSKRKRTGSRSKAKIYPPPITSLNQNGRPKFYLRPLRNDGRLELQVVRIKGLEVIRASRENGRLRLHLIVEEDVTDHAVEEEEEEEEEEAGEKEKEKIDREEATEEEEEIGGNWPFPAIRGGGEGYWRCHEVVSHHNHHHNNLHSWRQQYVTIR